MRVNSPCSDAGGAGGGGGAAWVGGAVVAFIILVNSPGPDLGAVADGVTGGGAGAGGA